MSCSVVLMCIPCQRKAYVVVVGCIAYWVQFAMCCAPYLIQSMTTLCHS